jgi:hypothetical protein
MKRNKEFRPGDLLVSVVVFILCWLLCKLMGRG